MSSIQQLLTDNIAIWIAAENGKKSGRGRSSGNGDSVYGIKKLRELILELAVRGKLVPQDPNDESASELLKRIKTEKTKLIVNCKIKKEKPLTSIPDKEEPFELPTSWKWLKLAELGLIIGGSTPKSDDSECWDDHGIPWLTPADLYGLREKYIGRGRRDISEKGLKTSSAQILPKGTVLFSSRAPIGYVAIAKNALATNQGFKSCVPFISDMTDYLYWYLKRSAKEIDSLASGTTFKEISGAGMAKVFVSVPPLAEQHRIVAKVDELMMLCDQMESQHINATEAHEKLVTHLLGTLTQSQSAEVFSENWERIAAHFDTLFTTETSIDALKQTILQLGVMGKLVPQDPNDEPASELLKRIQAEKVKLIAQGKIKKEKPLLPISDVEKPFELPMGWEFCLLPTICTKITDGEHFRPKTTTNGIYFLSAKDIREDEISFKDPLYIDDETASKARERCNPERGDILIVSRGATVGRSCIVNTNEVFCLLGSVILLKTSKEIEPLFFKYLMKTAYYRRALFGLSGSTAQPAIYLRDIKGIAVPLPSLPEQRRIVGKIDEFMMLSDQLKSRFSQVNLLKQKLADVMVEVATSK